MHPHFVLLETGDHSKVENGIDVSLDDPRDVLSDTPLDDGERFQKRKQHGARSHKSIESKQCPTKSPQPSQQVS